MRVRPIIVCTIVATVLAACGARADAAQNGSMPYFELFGTHEIHSQNLRQFHAWTAMLTRWTAEQHAASGLCSPGQSSNCEPREWDEMLKGLAPLDLYAKIETVNAEINRYPYVPPAASWNELDGWETPFEFFWRHGGQCQDYAIAKFMLLRAAGVSDEMIRVVVLRDIHLREDHAVTVVNVDGKAFLLDSLIKQVIPAGVVQHYRPYYSINETGWWLHLPIPLERLE